MGQLSALFYKNWLLYKRHLFGNILQILVPIIFIVLIVVIQQLDEPITYQKQSFLKNTTYSTTISSSDNTTAALKQCQAAQLVGLAPRGNALVNNLNSTLHNFGYTPHIFTDEAQLEGYIRAEAYQQNSKICFGITVQSSQKAYKYSLRFNISAREDRTDGPSTDLKLTEDQGIDLDLYSRSLGQGMIGANVLMQSAILQKQTNSSNHFTNHVSPVYQEDYTLNNTYENLKDSIGMIILLPLLLIYLRQTSAMLTQKQTRVRQSMYIMGMRGLPYYFSWFVRYFAVYLVVHLVGSIVVAVALSVPFYIPFLLLVLFDIVLIIQNFFIQVFLSRARIGIVISLVFFLLQYILSFLATNSDSPSLSANRAISIIPHAALVLAFRTLLYASSFQITPTFSENINQYIIGYALISFAINIIVYLFFTWYLDQVVPNQWGAKRHPLFCCHQDTTTISQEEKERRKRQAFSRPGFRDRFQDLPEGLASDENQRTIEMVTLRKEYEGKDDNKIVAVSDLTVRMLEGQIFALLGHNGAGKSTTISMLTGLTSPTDGYLSIYGQTDIQKVRQMLGVCPQHDTLYEDLTVDEHLQLFAALKGIQKQEIRAEVDKLIGDVNLQEKRDQYTKNLSGGQKRRLSVAIAFTGRSKVIILDQPTSGMDTSARRHIWNLLKTYKSSRIIILTTHFMDEADYLGDRIGIMGDGEMLCCGSSVFLKNQFGCGYSITFIKASPQVKSQQIIRAVRAHVPECEVLSDVGKDLTLQLPLEGLHRFPQLFGYLDQNKSELAFVDYGISVTTLQEVFLNVAEQIQKNKEKMNNQQMLEQPQGQNQETLESPAMSDRGMRAEEVEKEERMSQNCDIMVPIQSDLDHIPTEQGSLFLFFLHLRATFLKRVRVILRDLKSFIFELLLPLLIILGALFLLKVSFINDLDSRTLTVQTYLSEQSPVILPIGSNNPFLRQKISQTIASTYNTKVQIEQDISNTNVNDFDQFYLHPKKLSQETLKGGLYFNDSTLTNTTYAYYSLVNTRSPTSPFFLGNLASEGILNLIGKNISIQMSNHPLPRTQQQLQINNAISSFNASFIFSMALAFKFASIIAFIVKERVDRSKHQQIVSGMNIQAYWTANFAFDFLLYLIVAVVVIVIAKVLGIESLTEGSAFGALWLLFIFYGLSYIPFTYLASFYFDDHGNAQAAYYFITLVTGALLPIITFLLRILGQGSNKIGRGLAWVFRIYPSFAFGQGIINIGSVSLYGIRENNSITMDPFDLQIALAPIIYLAVGSLLFFILLLLLESLLNNQQFMRCFHGSELSLEHTNLIEEEDVRDQRDAALQAKPEDYQILAKGLRKVYAIDGPAQFKVAVDNLSFGIKKGQIFGLLGVNGAGKTTTFKMLAGQITSTSGDSYFQGLKISQNIVRVRQNLGYCPQFDALIEGLTAYEQLQLYYDLKSLSQQKKQAGINKQILELDLGQYSDKISGTLSGGNKRKLSVAMAMIGNPRILFLDQPSTGMDPRARRFMWRVISRVATERKDATVILTTHSMEEAEALSSRLGIMVKGNFRCLGTPQHIKSKYGEGLQVEVKLSILNRQELLELMRVKNIETQKVRKSQFEGLMTFLKVDDQDRSQITVQGQGSHIYHLLQSQQQISIFPLLDYFETCRLQRQLMRELGRRVGEVEQLQRLQGFIRLKVKGRPNIGKLFEVLELNKERLRIEQYAIKQASVQQIFNHFAELQDQGGLNQ